MNKLHTIITLLLISNLTICNLQLAIGQSDIPPEKQRTIDSLRHLIKTTEVDTAKVEALNQLSDVYRNISQYDNALQTARQSVRQAKQAGYQKGVAAGYNNIGIIQFNRGHYNKAMEYFHKARGIFEQIGNHQGMADSYGNIGIVHRNQGHYDKALKYYHKSLDLKEQIGDRQGMGKSYSNIGIIHAHQLHYDQALEYFHKARGIFEQFGYLQGMAPNYGNIAIIYKKQGHYDKALEYHYKSLDIQKQIGDRAGMALTYNNIGGLYTKLYRKDTFSRQSRQLKQEVLQTHPYALLDSARHYQQQSLRLAREIGHQQVITNASQGLGNILQQREQYRQALPYYRKAARMADSTGARARLYKAYKGLSECYKELGQYSNAYKYHVKYAEVQDSVHSVESKEKIAEMEQQYQAEKRQRKIAEQEAELQKQRLWLYGAGGGLLLILLFSGLLYNRFRVTRSQKQVIETAHNILEEKNRQITSSINYAKRIQVALLGEEEHVTPELPPHFVLLKPQSTVSGDFHWAVKKNDEWYVAVADCTGHGVPGGFLTMLGTAFLNEITSRPGQVKPAEVLNELRKRFIKELGEAEKESDTGMRMRDGMDISLLRLNLKTHNAQWAGANNPLYVVSGSEFRVSGTKWDVFNAKDNNPKHQIQNKKHETRNTKLYELPPDKQPISYTEAPQPFTNHEFKLQKNDSLYLFSDGFPDQFGGPKGKKFKKKRFKSTLLNLQDKKMDEQKERLDQNIEDWMAQNDEEQIDDICILGVKIA
jgi:tetratricopeptide (TPR) repeat protein